MEEGKGRRITVQGFRTNAMTEGEFERYMDATLPASEHLAFAKQIRKRRRRLGQYGFCTRKMAVPK